MFRSVFYLSLSLFLFGIGCADKPERVEPKFTMPAGMSWPDVRDTNQVSNECVDYINKTAQALNDADLTQWPIVAQETNDTDNLIKQMSNQAWNKVYQDRTISPYHLDDAVYFYSPKDNPETYYLTNLFPYQESNIIPPFSYLEDQGLNLCIPTDPDKPIKPWKTTEHYFQAQKFISDKSLQDQIRNIRAPTAVIKIAGKNSQKTQSAWRTSAKQQVMLDALIAKFTQDEVSKTGIMKTKNNLLIENPNQENHSDPYWGISSGRIPSSIPNQPDHLIYNYQGLNMLGQMLMYVRAVILNKKPWYKNYKKDETGKKFFLWFTPSGFFYPQIHTRTK